MPFYRIKSGRTVTFYSADIYICFKSSDRHFHDFFYLICFCFDNNHLTSPNCLTTSELSFSSGFCGFLFRKLCIHTIQKFRNKRCIFKSIKYIHQCF